MENWKCVGMSGFVMWGSLGVVVCCFVGFVLGGSGLRRWVEVVVEV